LVVFDDPLVRVVGQMSEPSGVEKRPITETLSPVGWRRAFEEVMAEAKRKRQKAQSWMLAAMAVITLMVTLFVVALKLFDVMS
jgi:hypothetical protein